RRRADAVADDGEDLAVGRTVLPLGIGEVGRQRLQLRAHLAVALAALAVAARAVLGVELLAGSDRLGVGCHRVFQLRRLGMLMRTAFGGVLVVLDAVGG